MQFVDRKEGIKVVLSRQHSTSSGRGEKRNKNWDLRIKQKSSNTRRRKTEIREICNKGYMCEESKNKQIQTHKRKFSEGIKINFFLYRTAIILYIYVYEFIIFKLRFALAYHNRKTRFKCAGNSCHYEIKHFCFFDFSLRSNFASCAICLWSMVSYIKGGTKTKGIWKQDPEMNIWTQDECQWWGFIMRNFIVCTVQGD